MKVNAQIQIHRDGKLEKVPVNLFIENGSSYSVHVFLNLGDDRIVWLERNVGTIQEVTRIMEYYAKNENLMSLLIERGV